MPDYGLPDDEDVVDLSLADDIFPPVEDAEATYEPILRHQGRHSRSNPTTTGLEQPHVPGGHEYTVGLDSRTNRRLKRQATERDVTPEQIIDRALRHYLDWLEMYFP